MALIKTEREIALMRISGKILAKTLHALKEEVRAGVTGLDLDREARRLIRSLGGEPAFLGYRPDGAERPFPAALCVSINEVVVHGVPNSRQIKNGDVVKIDLGVRIKGWHSDSAVTVIVGEASEKVKGLVQATEDALYEGIRAAVPGKTLGDIGYAIQKVAAKRKVSVVQGLTGHGIGLELHEDPVVFNEGKPHTGNRLRPGMTIAIEPMFSLGSPRVAQQKDEGYATADKSVSAHFEHTILITPEGPEILTVI